VQNKLRQQIIGLSVCQKQAEVHSSNERTQKQATVTVRCLYTTCVYVEEACLYA